MRIKKIDSKNLHKCVNKHFAVNERESILEIVLYVIPKRNKAKND